MALDPLSIAHLGFAYKPLVAAMLGLWDEIVEAILEMYRGGRHAGRRDAERERLFREHWDYLDELRQIQVRIADDAGGARTITIPAAMPLPAAVAGRAMRGTVPTDTPPTVADILGDPLALSLLAVLIDEATNY